MGEQFNIINLKGTLEDRGWQQMKFLLDKEKSRKTTLLRQLMPYAAAVALLIFAGYVFFSSQTNVQVAENVNQNTSSVWNTINTNQAVLNDNFPVSTGKIGALNKKIELENVLPISAAKQEISIEPKNAITLKNSVLLTEEIALNDEANNGGTTEKTLYSTMLRKQKLASNQQASNEVFSPSEIPGTKNTAKKNPEPLTLPIPISTFSNTTKSIETTASVGVITSGFDSYGYRTGIELQKPLNKKLAVTSGLRYSRYNDEYGAAYKRTDGEQRIIKTSSSLQQLNTRDVKRNFLEVPVYLNYDVADNMKVKAGIAFTYNSNQSAAISLSTISTSQLSPSSQGVANELLNDHKGYLGEAVIGTTVQFDKVAIEAEVVKGIVGFEEVNNRSVVGVRLSYSFGAKK